MRYAIEGYRPHTRAGDGREVVTQHFVEAENCIEALRDAGAKEPGTVWYMAYSAEDMVPLRAQREQEFRRASGRAPLV